MRIALTGHTKGLGLSLYNSLSKDHEVVGFSRSNNYDIKNPHNRSNIIDMVKDVDVFINLVHNYYHQSDLLLQLHKSWKGLNKTIINVSSGVVQDDEWANNDYDMMEYKIQKINLETMATYLNKINALPTLITYTISEINFEVDTNNIVKLINEKIH